MNTIKKIILMFKSNNEFLKPFIIIWLFQYLLILFYYLVYKDSYGSQDFNNILFFTLLWVISNFSLVVSCSYISKQIKPFEYNKIIYTKLFKIGVLYSIVSLFMILLSPINKNLDTYKNSSFSFIQQFLRIGVFLLIPEVIYSDNKNLSKSFKNVQGIVKKKYKSLIKKIISIDVFIFLISAFLALFFDISNFSFSNFEFNKLVILIFIATFIWTTRTYLEQLSMLLTYHKIK